LGESSEAVLSDENLLGSPLDGYETATERLQLLREVLKGRTYQLVVYLRPQTEWLSSLYLQGVQEGSGTGPERFWSQVQDFPLLRWSRLVQLLEAESGAERLRVRAFIPGRDVVADFFSAARLGAPPVAGDAVVAENVSIRAIQAPVLSLLSSSSKISARDHVQLRRVFQGFLRLDAPVGMSPFPVDVQRAIAEAFVDDWALLTSSLELQGSADGPAFRSALQNWPQQPLPYAGASLGDPHVQAEALRSLLALALDRQETTSGPVRRFVTAMRHRPREVPAMALRRLERHF